MEFEGWGEAVRIVTSQAADKHERAKWLERYPELIDTILINNCHKAGIGTIEEILRLKKKYGEEWLRKLLRFKIIDAENNRE